MNGKDEMSRLHLELALYYQKEAAVAHHYALYAVETGRYQDARRLQDSATYYAACARGHLFTAQGAWTERDPEQMQ